MLDHVGQEGPQLVAVHAQPAAQPAERVAQDLLVDRAGPGRGGQRYDQRREHPHPLVDLDRALGESPCSFSAILLRSARSLNLGLRKPIELSHRTLFLPRQQPHDVVVAGRIFTPILGETDDVLTFEHAQFSSSPLGDRTTAPARRRRRPHHFANGRFVAVIVTIVGARPNFMKAAPIHAAFRRAGVAHELIHTGQHYDAAMSKVFFEDLGMPRPIVDLGVGSGTHAEQTGAVMVGLEKFFGEKRPRAVLVVGDVNSTMAAVHRRGQDGSLLRPCGGRTALGRLDHAGGGESGGHRLAGRPPAHPLAGRRRKSAPRGLRAREHRPGGQCDDRHPARAPAARAGAEGGRPLRADCPQLRGADPAPPLQRRRPGGAGPDPRDGGGDLPEAPGGVPHPPPHPAPGRRRRAGLPAWRRRPASSSPIPWVTWSSCRSPRRPGWCSPTRAACRRRAPCSGSPA